MATPEGKVKAKISAVLRKYPKLYKFMPVPGGYGPSSLDYIVCYKGKFIAIEAKAPNRTPTTRQEAIMGAIREAGGKVFLVDGVNGELELLDRMLRDATSSGKRKA